MSLGIGLLLVGAFMAFAPPEHIPDGAWPEPPPPPRVVWIDDNAAVVDGALVRFRGGETLYDGAEFLVQRIADVPLESGDQGAPVERLQALLANLKLYRGPIDAKYGPQMRSAVIAYHKLHGVERTADWTVSDWATTGALDHDAILNRHRSEANRVEVDIGNQLMYVILEGRVSAIVHVSTGNGATYWSETKGPSGGYRKARTPRGNFRITRHIAGWRYNYLGGLYKPWYFQPAYAIHGSRSVPARPASHGCVRVPTWEADHLDRFLRIGLPVHIWDT